MASGGEEGKVALVTGSSSGIGEACVRLLSQKGYKVVVCGSRKDKVERVVADCFTLSPHKFQPLGLVLDFNEPINGELAVKRTVEHFGRLDVLVNNAGIFVKSAGDDPTTYDLYRQTMAINTDATVRATLAATGELKKTSGSIVFVSSVASSKASERGYAYCMSKAAMSMFAKCLAIDLAPQVRVNVVSPGPVQTPIFERVGLDARMVRALMSNTTLVERIGECAEIAQVVYFLVSEEASFVNGHEMFVDGGYLLKPSSGTASQQIIAAKEAAAAAAAAK